MKHIAVVLRGHFRTFEYTHKVVFDFYDSIAENVDYYVSTWRTEVNPQYKFRELFNNFDKTPIKILEVPIISELYNSWKGPSWLNYNIIPYKKLREREIKYDAVFDTRPDIIYQLKNKDLLIFPKPMTLYTTRHMITDRQSDNTTRVGVEDWMFMSTSEVHDLMSYRFIEQNQIGTHNTILKIANEQGINTVAMPWLDCNIVRPNVFEEIPDPFKYFSTKGIDGDLLKHNWMNMPTQNKINLLHKYNILQEDFNTISISAKL
jgi:hypothetical protein